MSSPKSHSGQTTKEDDRYQKGFTAGTFAQANGETRLELSNLIFIARHLSSLVDDRLSSSTGEGLDYIGPLLGALDLTCTKARNLKMQLDDEERDRAGF